MQGLFVRAAAERDLERHYVYLAENADLAVADRFLVSVESSFATLRAQPQIGAPLHLKHSALVSLRKWRVRDFEKFLIFYEPRLDGVSIVRVLHAAQDWWAILDA